jgi:hypothetical protein
MPFWYLAIFIRYNIVFNASQIQFPICKPEESVHNKVRDYINAAPQANHYIGKSKAWQPH